MLDQTACDIRCSRLLKTDLGWCHARSFRLENLARFLQYIPMWFVPQDFDMKLNRLALILLLHVETIKKDETEKVVLNFSNCLSLSFVFYGLYGWDLNHSHQTSFCFLLRLRENRSKYRLDRSTRAFPRTRTQENDESSYMVFRQRNSWTPIKKRFSEKCPLKHITSVLWVQSLEFRAPVIEMLFTCEVQLILKEFLLCYL